MEQRGKKKRNSPAAREAQRLREERARQEQERELRQKRAKQREKQARKERSSRAAQTAQRQREERREDTRLDTLRQKQRKEARQRAKRRISPVFWRRLFIMAGVTAAIILTLVIFFRVNEIVVEGNNYYTAEEIIAACGVEKGDNLLTISRGKVAGNLLSQEDTFRYLKDVRVVRELPDGLKLIVTEYPATYAVTDTEGNWYLITSEGEAVELAQEQEAKKHITVTGLSIQPCVLGETVSVAQEEAVQSSAEAKKTALVTVLQALEDAELVKSITTVHIPTAYNITLQYTDRFEVTLGSTERIDYKLEYLKEVIALQKSYDTGTIDLTFSGADQAIVKLDE